MRRCHILLALIIVGTQSLLTQSWEVNSLAGNSFSPAHFAISLESYTAAFIASAYCVDDEERSGVPIGCDRELCDECESCTWKKRSGFASETEWETAVTAEMSRLRGNNTNIKEATAEGQIVGTWVAEAPLSLRLMKATIVELNSKLGVSFEDSPVVPETQDRVYYLVSGTPSEVQGLLAAGFATVTPIPPRLKVDPVLEAAAAGIDTELQATRGGGRSAAENDLLHKREEGADDGRHLHIQITLPPTASRAGERGGGGRGGGLLTSSSPPLYSNSNDSSSITGVFPGPLPPPGSVVHELSSAWTSSISSRLGHSNAKVMAEGEQHVTVKGLQSSAEWYQVALEIAHHGAVKWVAPQNRLMPSNYFARQLVESGSWQVPEVWNGALPPAEYNPLSAMGLTGKGEVVGLADTGLDWNSCFFKDDKVTPVFKWSEEKRRKMRNKKNAGDFSMEIWSSTKHRKIRQYVAFMNGKEDENDGHGTHIAGSVAGSCLEQDLINRDYSGVAPDAKIAFFDTYSKTEPNVHGVPSNLPFMFKRAYDAGARVYVASFNEDVMKVQDGWKMLGTYSHMAKSLDRYCHIRQTFIVLTSAGNTVSHSNRRRPPSSTISRPADSKNAVTVGSHLNPNKQNREAGTPAHLTGRILSVAEHSARGPTHDRRIKPDVCGPGDGVYSAAATVTPLSRASADEQGPTAAIPTATATPVRPTLSAPPAAAAAAATDDDAEVLPGTATPVVLPGAATMTDDAPGNCRGVVKHGTSSANAIVAGVTVLVRQYFTKGYYPDGVKKKMRGFTPMGALLKAVLVNSGRALTVPGNQGGQLEDLPNNIMGWGGVNIASTLVTPSSPRGLQLKVFGRSNNNCEFLCPHVSQDQVKVYKIKTTPETYGLPLKITLVWYDKEAESMTRKTLVDDLDLTVMEHGATQRDDIHYFPNGGTMADHTNTVEHIQVSTPKPSTEYTIKVTGTVVTGWHPYYALVISGPFDAKATTQKKGRIDPGSSGRATRGTRAEDYTLIPVDDVVSSS